MKYLILIFSCFIYVYTTAQTVTVFDKSTLTPVEGVVITAGDNQVITDEKGITSVSELDTNLTWTTSHIAYLPEVIKFNDIRIYGFKIGLTARIFPLNEIVISGNRFSERKSTVTYETLVLRDQEIQRLAPLSPADLLEKTGQVFVQRSQAGGGSPVLRGFEANKILLMLDGVRMNNAIFRSGHLHNIFNQDEQTISRAEVIYGSGPVVYGSDALGGVISLFTEEPVLTDTVSFKMNYKGAAQFFSANEGQAYNLGFNIAGKKLASLTSASISNFKDLRQGSIRNRKYSDFGKRFWFVDRIEVNDTVVDAVIPNEDPDVQIPSGYTQNNFLQKLLFKQSDLISHGLNVQVNETSPQPFYARLTQTDSAGIPLWAEWNYGRQNHFFLSYKLELVASSRIFDETKLIVAYQRYKESRETRRFNSEWRAFRTEEVLGFSVNSDYLKRINNKHEISYGIEYWLNDVSSTALASNIIITDFENLDTRYPDGGNNMWSAAGYLAHTWNYKPSVIFHNGIRLTHTYLNTKFINKNFFDFPFNEIEQHNSSLSGSTGVVVNPSRNLKYSFALSTAFRVPNVDDIGKIFETSPGFVVVPNQNLKPERTFTAETGLTYLLTNTLRTTINLWYTFYNDIITLQSSTFNNSDSLVLNGIPGKVIQQQNADRAFLHGGSLSVEADLGFSFSIYSYLTYTYGRIKTDTINYPLDHIPPLYGKTGIAWKGNKLRLDAYSNYNAEKKLKDYNFIGEDNFAFATPEGMPSWYIFNLSLMYKPINELNIRLAAENILDINYRPFASGISAPGRNFIAGFRFYF